VTTSYLAQQACEEISATRETVPPLRSWAVQVWGVRSGRAILLTSAAAGIAIGIELHLARQIGLWLRTGQGV
jgi:hypothetical protein